MWAGGFFGVTPVLKCCLGYANFEWQCCVEVGECVSGGVKEEGM
jgi:hypothetical protein